MMGLFNWLTLGSQIEKPIEAIGNLYTTDKARLEGETEYQKVVQQPTIAQIENNKILAMTGKLFNSGWTPLLGWTAGFLILLYYAPQMMIVIYVWGQACLKTGVITPFPMDSKELMNLVYLLFGFGGYNLIHKKIT